MVNEELRNAMDEKILEEIDKLGALAPGSDEQVKAVKSIAELYKLRVDEEQSEAENSLKAEQIADAAVAEKKKLKQNWVITGVNGLVSLATLGLTFAHESGLALKCLKFEETGSFQSVISKGLFSKILRKR